MGSGRRLEGGGEVARQRVLGGQYPAERGNEDEQGGEGQKAVKADLFP